MLCSRASTSSPPYSFMRLVLNILLNTCVCVGALSPLDVKSNFRKPHKQGLRLREPEPSPGVASHYSNKTAVGTERRTKTMLRSLSLCNLYTISTHHRHNGAKTSVRNILIAIGCCHQMSHGSLEATHLQTCRACAAIVNT